MKRILIALFAVASIAFVHTSAPARAATTHPNVVILMSDDQRWDKVTPRYMPNVSQAFDFSALTAFAPNSLCCPSRTSVLTGDYSHTTGVWDNIGIYAEQQTAGAEFIHFLRRR